MFRTFRWLVDPMFAGVLRGEAPYGNEDDSDAVTRVRKLISTVVD